MTASPNQPESKALDRFKDLELFQMLTSVVSDYMGRSGVNFSVLPSECERYCMDVLISAGDILSCLDELYSSTAMLSGYRNALHPTMSRTEYIHFMIENYYLRITSIKDRTLRFVNIVFKIGLPERECKDSTVVKNENVKKTEIYDILLRLEKIVTNYREKRNTIAHSKSYFDQGLFHAGAYELLIRSGDSDMVKYDHLIKTQVDNFIGSKKIVFLETCDKIERLLVSLFESIYTIVDKNCSNLV